MVKIANASQKVKSDLLASLYRENQRLIDQRIKDLEEIDLKNQKILDQQDEIILLYSKVNSEPVLMVTKGGVL